MCITFVNNLVDILNNIMSLNQYHELQIEDDKLNILSLHKKYEHNILKHPNFRHIRIALSIAGFDYYNNNYPKFSPICFLQQLS